VHIYGLYRSMQYLQVSHPKSLHHGKPLQSSAWAKSQRRKEHGTKLHIPIDTNVLPLDQSSLDLVPSTIPARALILLRTELFGPNTEVHIKMSNNKRS
jgi:hypothetical protein